MAKPKSAAEIIGSREFLESQADAAKYLRHEFQDFGYRMAMALGDLQHRPIYMKLAKSVRRPLLEQALAFAVDYRDEPNKGRLFMWKLKQLRDEAELKQAAKNFSHDFVMKRMAVLYDVLVDEVVAKQKAEFSEARQQMVAEFSALLHSNKTGRGKLKILDICCRAGLDSKLLCDRQTTVHSLDISPKLVSKAKKLCKGCKVVRKQHFLLNTYKPEQFHGIWAAHLWPIVPTKMEKKYLVELLRIVKPGGHIILGVKLGKQEETWRRFEWKEQAYISFEKTNRKSEVEALFKKFGLNKIKATKIDNITFYFLQA